MKNLTVRTWQMLGTTGRIFLFCFLFYFIAKTMQKH